MRRILFVLSALALSACTTVKPMAVTADAMNSVHGQKLTVVTQGKPSFVAMTYGKAGFAMLGALAMIAEGDQIVANNRVEDPALQIAAKLTPIVTQKLGASSAVTATDPTTSQLSGKQLADTASHDGVVLDVQTLGWNFVYFPLDWTHYKVMYSAEARLVDASGGNVIGQALCNYDTGDKEPPTYDQLLANSATLLKAKLSEAADACVEKFSTTMLGG